MQVQQVHFVFPLVSVQIASPSCILRETLESHPDQRFRGNTVYLQGCKYVQVQLRHRERRGHSVAGYRPSSGQALAISWPPPAAGGKHQHPIHRARPFLINVHNFAAVANEATLKVDRGLGTPCQLHVYARC